MAGGGERVPPLGSLQGRRLFENPAEAHQSIMGRWSLLQEGRRETPAGVSTDGGVVPRPVAGEERESPFIHADELDKPPAATPGPPPSASIPSPSSEGQRAYGPPEWISSENGTGSQVGTSLLEVSAAGHLVGAPRAIPTVWARSSFSLPSRQAAGGRPGSNGTTSTAVAVTTTDEDENDEGEWATIGAESTQEEREEQGAIPPMPFSGRASSYSSSSRGSFASVDLFDYTRLPAVLRVSSGLGVVTPAESNAAVVPVSGITLTTPPSPPRPVAYSPYLAYQTGFPLEGLSARRASNNPFLTRPARPPYVLPSTPRHSPDWTPSRPQSHPACARVTNSETRPLTYVSGTSATPTFLNYDASTWSPGIRRFPQATPTSTPEGIELETLIRRPTPVAESSRRRRAKAPADDLIHTPSSNVATVRRNRRASQYEQFVSPGLASSRFPRFTTSSNDGSTDRLIRPHLSQRSLLPLYRDLPPLHRAHLPVHNVPNRIIQQKRGDRVCWITLAGCSIFFPLLPLYFGGYLDEGLALLTHNAECKPSDHQKSIAKFVAWLWAALLLAGAIIIGIEFGHFKYTPMLGMVR
ncbi:hypothetical protein MBLNU459_g2258t1 [Dothideomycetes sp. NU459]